MVSTKDSGVVISTNKLPGRPIRNDRSTNKALGGDFSEVFKPSNVC